MSDKNKKEDFAFEKELWKFINEMRKHCQEKFMDYNRRGRYKKYSSGIQSRLKGMGRAYLEMYTTLGKLYPKIDIELNLSNLPAEEEE